MISSRQNPLYKEFYSLRTRQGRSKSGLFLVEGVRLVEEALAAGHPIKHAVFSERLMRTNRGWDCFQTLSAAGVDLYEVSDQLLQKLADTQRSQGLVVAMSLPAPLSVDFDFWAGGDLFLIIDGIQDPGNLGTILRTAEALGVDKVVALKGTVDPYNDKVIRSTMGAIFRLPLAMEVDPAGAIRALQDEGIQIVVSSLAASRPYDEAAFGERVALVVGNEGAGVADAWSKAADLLVHIPMVCQAESLNAAVATGIILAQVAQIRRHGKL